MSRSYRKPYLKDNTKNGGAKIAKRTANHKVRKTKELANGKSYKKVYNSWNIHDFSFYSPNWKGGKARRK